MKKQTLLLLAGGLLTIASCTSEPGATGGYTQEQMDSAVTARVAELQGQMQASNDSAINALAQIKADEMIAAMKGGSTIKKTTVKSNPTTTTTTTTTTPPVKAKNDVTDRNNTGTRNNNDVTDRKTTTNNKTDNDVTNRK
jgi:hypothetical protein